MLGLRVPGVSNLLLVYINRRAFAAKSRFLRMATSRGFSAAVFDMIVNKGELVQVFSKQVKHS